MNQSTEKETNKLTKAIIECQNEHIEVPYIRELVWRELELVSKDIKDSCGNTMFWLGVAFGISIQRKLDSWDKKS